MHTTSKKSPALSVIEEAEAQTKTMYNLRAELRRQSQPGDPERESRLLEAVTNQMLVMSKVRGMLAKLQWETVRVTPAQEKRLRAAAKALAAERRQAKKMMRT